jgi:type I restriction enzyme S subunit
MPPFLCVYPSYRKTDLPWLAQIPAHWEVRRLKHVANVTFSSVDKLSHEDEKPVLLSNYVDVYKNEQITADLEFMKATASDDEIKRFTLRKNDVLVTKDSESWDDIAIPAYVPNDLENVLCGYHLALIRPKPNQMDGKFLLRALQSKTIRYQFEVEATGITRYGIDQYAIGSTFFPVPPLPEQQTIATYLDHQTAKIDALIAKKQRLLELLAEQRAALISQAVTKGLNPDVKMKDSGVAWLGQVPSHWEVEKNKQVYREVDDRSEYGDEELLTVSHITGVTTRAEKEVNMFMAESLEGYKRCRAGDLAINTMWAWMGALGISPVDGIVSPSYNVYRFRNPNQFDSRYLDYLYRTPQHIIEINRYSKGIWSSRLRLYPDEFFLMVTPKPPYEEQKHIVEYLNKKLGQMKLLADKVEAAIELQREYRAALISSVVTGKVQVKDE